MITPSYGLTATERVLPSFTLDWTTGLTQGAVGVTRAGVATFVGSNGLIQSASADTQRIDYSTGVAGLLVEESRSNISTYSEDFLNTAAAGETRPWGWTRLTVSLLAGTAPDDTNNANELIEDTTASSTHQIQRNYSVTSGASYTLSFFAKKNTRDWIALDMFDGTNHKTYFDLTNGTVGTVGSGATASIDALADGWYRCKITRTVAAATITAVVNIATGDNVASYTGESKSIYGFGAQLEAGAFATSYIPTEASAVTRNADVATVTGTNFSDFFNATEGTFGIEAYFLDANALAADRKPLFYAGDGVSNVSNVFEIGRQENNGNPYMRAMTYSGGATQTSFNMGLSTGQPVSAVMGYKVDSVSGAINGNNPVSDTSATMPVGIDQLRLGSNTTIFMSGWVRSFRYWPQRLINNEIRAFSK